jgi:catechol 2,3-dioxygenase-like lactoylglutathione lyase family enzyme
MKFEHFALNVPDARAMSRWYVEHLGFVVVRRREDAPYTHFLADETGRLVVELYSNPSATIPDYAAGHPLVMHLALFTPDAGAVAHRLERAGAKPFSDEKLPDGSRLMFLRDPWGVPLPARPALPGILSGLFSRAESGPASGQPVAVRRGRTPVASW